MPRRDPRAFLADILAAADAINTMLHGIDFVAYAESIEKRSAVERQLLNIGEAMNHLRRLRPEWMARFTTPDRIVAFRNILAHGYYMVMPDVVFDIATNHVPALRAEVAALVEETRDAA